MKIKFYGHACFSIEQSGFTVVTDPHENIKGLSADVLTVSSRSSHHSHTEGVTGDPKIFDWPGEYETQSYHFKSIAVTVNSGESKALNNVFKINFKGVKVAHLSSPGIELTDDQLEALGDVDILFVPVGGGADPKKIKKIVEEIEPRLLIPMRYIDEKGEQDQSALNQFLSDMGAPATEALDEFIFKKSELPEESSRVVVLNATL